MFNMAIRVTDLEKFALEQIWRPYQNDFRSPAVRGVLNELPYSLGETMSYLNCYSEWRHKVLKRIAEIGFEFPDYIKHPLVDYIKTAVDQINKQQPCLSNGDATPEQQKEAAKHVKDMSNTITRLDEQVIKLKNEINRLEDELERCNENSHISFKAGIGHQEHARKLEKQIQTSFDKWSKQLGWGIEGHQPECWVLMDQEVNKLVEIRARVARKPSIIAKTLR